MAGISVIRFSITVMGFSSLVLQVTCLRQLLAVFSGNELDIAITLSIWLVAAGAGSYTGWRIRPVHAFPLSFILIAVLAQTAVIVIPMARDIFSYETGEVVPLAASFLITVLVLALPCFVIGCQFPAAVGYSAERPSVVYGLEALGAFAGGVVFTLAFSGRLDAFQTTMALGLLNILASVLLTGKRPLLLLLAIPVSLYFLGERLYLDALETKGSTLAERVESRYGEITVFRTKGQHNVYVTGKFTFSYYDPQAEELRSHLPASVHPSPERVLLVGGSPALIREFLKYPEVRRVHYVETDPKLVDVSIGLLSVEDAGAVMDGRAKIIAADPRLFVKRSDAAYDLIVLNTSEPSTGSLNRFYTVDFFEELRKTLDARGVVALGMPVSYGYMSRGTRTLNGTVYRTLSEVFPHVEVSSEEYGYMFASPGPIDTDPDVLAGRFAGRGMETRYFKPYIFEDAFSPLRTLMVRGELGKARQVNTDARPVAYLYNLLLWAEAQGGGVLKSLLEPESKWAMAAGAVLLLIAFAVTAGRRQPGYYVLFTTGYSVMAFSVVLILRYQASYGYVYEAVGLLAASFMAGMALGAFAVRGPRGPLRTLLFSETAAVALFAASPLFFGTEALFYALSLLCGIIGGAEFAAVSLFVRHWKAEERAGRLYGIDLLGSFAGAFLTAIPAVPHFGVHGTLGFLVLMKAVSLALLLSVRRKSG